MAKGQPVLTARDFSILDIPGFAERMTALARICRQNSRRSARHSWGIFWT